MRTGAPEPVAPGPGGLPGRRARAARTRRWWLRSTAVAVAVSVVAAGLALFAVALATTSSSASSSAPVTLRRLFEARGRYLGTTVDGLTLASPSSVYGPYRALAGTEYGALTPRHELAWDTTEPSPGSFSFARSDPVVEFARRHDQAVHGGDLVSEENLPAWVAEGAASADDLRTMLTNHVAGVVAHFKGKITKWDVVSGLFNDDGSRRATVFQRVLGDGYLVDALRAARAADPAARLYLSDAGIEGGSDAGIEGGNAKSQAMYDLVQSLKAQGVPLDGVDMRARLALGQVPANLRANLQRFADLGLDVALSQLEIRIRYPADATKLARQAADYATITRTCLLVARCVGVTVGGVYDSESEVVYDFPGFGSPLLFDGSFHRKPAYDAVVSAFSS